uniref:Uncharacterized protein n=1 Tax=Arion vulgaris TaxID=1028688 RepID=A0A0B6XXP6_9EUPU
MDKWMDGRMNGWLDGWLDLWTDGWIDIYEQPRQGINSLEEENLPLKLNSLSNTIQHLSMPASYS